MDFLIGCVITALGLCALYAAVRLCRGYANRERIVYVVEDTGDGNVRVIGPSLPPEFVADLFERAAEGYAENAAPECLGSLN